ncbi:MAG: hypothetical protein AB4050_16630 [Synechococcus sp.]
MHMLGLVRSGQGAVDAAIALIEPAIALAPNQAAYHNNLGGLNRQLGRMERATHCFLQVLCSSPITPSFIRLYNNPL